MRSLIDRRLEQLVNYNFEFQMKTVRIPIRL